MREENNCSNCYYAKASKHDENYEVIELYCKKHDKFVDIDDWCQWYL